MVSNRRRKRNNFLVEKQEELIEIQDEIVTTKNRIIKHQTEMIDINTKILKNYKSYPKGANWNHNITTPLFLSINFGLLLILIVFGSFGSILWFWSILVINFIWSWLFSQATSRHNYYTIYKGDYKVRKFKFF